MQLLKISELTPHPKNDYYFDNIAGDPWKEFLRSVETSGVIEPVVINQNKVIISGHQRVRACKELGITEVLTEMRQYESEDAILKDLIETNIMTRGIGNPNPVKFGRCIKELERIYGIQQGNNQYSLSNNFTSSPHTEEELADTLQITRQTLQNYKLLADMIPEIQDLVDTGIVTPTTARAIFKQLSEDEQRELAEQLAGEGKKKSNREVQFYIDRIKQLTDENKKLKDAEPTVVKETVEVKPADYESIKEELRQKTAEITELQKQLDKQDAEILNPHEAKIKELQAENEQLKQKAAEAEKETKEIKNDAKVITSAGFLMRENKDILFRSREFQELFDLYNRIKQILAEDLSPIRYSTLLSHIDDSEMIRRHIQDLINLVLDWATEMDTINNRNYKIIDVGGNEA